MLGLPYMGSKRKIAKNIVNYIVDHNPNLKYIYDLFGGGGAISFEFLKRGYNVTYNELNTGVTELLKKIQKDGVTEDFYIWISREDFFKYKDNSDWFGGLIKTVWSFGNNQKDYLFNKEIEQYKKDYHSVVVFKLYLLFIIKIK
jgi:site-specific DNA-adenine methylase